MDRLTTSTVTVPEGVKAGVSNWRIWSTSSLKVAPVFTVPLANCGTLVGYTTGSGGNVTARVAYLNERDELEEEWVLAEGLECRGLAAEPGGHFAALLWDDAGDRIYVRRFDLTGAAGWSTELINASNKPTEFDIGESRLEFGDGRYGAYYHVHSDDGHEGDSLKWVDAESGEASNGWSWGCSHSMSNLLRFNPEHDVFLPACVTDCFPGTPNDGVFSNDSIGGIYLNRDQSKVMDVAAGCNGRVAGELGGAAPNPSGWKLVFNAHQNPATSGQASYDPDTMNQDIGFASVAANLDASSVVWLTDTPGLDEADASIARWQPADDSTEQYVVGWSVPGSSTTYRLARIDGAGAFLEEPVDVTARARWGRRDDPFREHQNGDVVWSWFDEAGSTTLNVARLRSGRTAECASF